MMAKVAARDTFTDYHEAYEAARQDADLLHRPMGIEKAREYGRTIYRVKMLPKRADQRFGWELACEVVEPGMPRCVRGKDLITE